MQQRPGDEDLALSPASLRRYRRRGLVAALGTALPFAVAGIVLAVVAGDARPVAYGVCSGLMLGGFACSLVTTRPTWAILRLPLTTGSGDRRRLRRIRRAVVRNRPDLLEPDERTLASRAARLTHATLALSLPTLAPLVLGLGGLQILTLTEAEAPTWRVLVAKVFLGGVAVVLPFVVREALGTRRFLADVDAGERIP